MNKIKEYLTDYQKHDLEKIYYDGIKSHGYSYYKIDFYNAEIKHPLQKYWLFIPSVKIYDKTYNTLELSLSHNLISLCSFVESLEDKIKEIIYHESKKELTMKSCLRKPAHLPPSLSVNLNKKSFIFDEDNKLTDNNYLKSDQTISLYIELSEVWLGPVYFGFNWNILQCKVCKIIDFTTSLFGMIEDETDSTFTDNCIKNIPYKNSNKYKHEETIPEPPPITNVPINKKLPSNQDLHYTPSLSDLLTRLKTLKKIPKENKEIIDDKLEMQNLKLNPIPKLEQKPNIEIVRSKNKYFKKEIVKKLKELEKFKEKEKLKKKLYSEIKSKFSSLSSFK